MDSAPSPVRALGIVSDPYIGYFFLALTSHGKCVATPANVPQTHLPLGLPKPRVDANSTVQSFESQIAPLLTKSVPSSYPKLVGTSMSFSSPESLDLLIHTISKLQESHILFIINLQAEISSRYNSEGKLLID